MSAQPLILSGPTHDRLKQAYREAARAIGDPRLIRWVERLIAGDQAPSTSPQPAVSHPPDKNQGGPVSG